MTDFELNPMTFGKEQPMTDEEYIEQGIELANEWRRSNKYVVCIDGCQHWYSTGETKMPSYLLDALAAQLVRQVDAVHLEDGRHCKVAVWPNYTQVTAWNASGGDVLREAQGTDRTMNTIKAIVDLGVLSTAQGEQGG